MGDRGLWKRKWIDLSEWRNNVKIIVPHVNVYKRATQHRGILTIKHIGWPLPWIIVDLFPWLTLSLPNGLGNKVTMMAEITVVHGLNKMGFHWQRPTWLQSLLNSQATNSKYTKYKEGHHFPVWHASYLVRWQFYWTASITEGKELCHYWKRHLLWVWICLPWCNISAQTTFHRLTECLIYSHSITQYWFWPKNSLHSKQNAAVGPWSWHLLILQCSPTIPK